MRRFLGLSLILGVVVLFAIAIWSGRQRAEPEEPAASRSDHVESSVPTVEIATDDLVQARQAAFYLSAMAMSRINAGVKYESDDIEYLQWPAAFLSQWADALPLLFPEGSDNDETEALASVWEDREGFETAAARLAQATEALSAIARDGGGIDAFRAKRTEVVAACDACHDRYHTPD